MQDLTGVGAWGGILFIREGWFLEQNCNMVASVNSCELTDASHQDKQGA